MPTLMLILITSTLMATLLVTAVLECLISPYPRKEDGEYTCVPVNKVGTGSNASVGITAVGEFSVELTAI